MHPRVSLHQVACMDDPTAAFIEHCRTIGVQQMTLVTPLLFRQGETEAALGAMAAGGTRCHTVNHPFAMGRTLDTVGGEETEGLLRAIDIAAALGAPNIYLVSGGRGNMLWDEAAGRFAALIAPCLGPAQEKGVRLLVETASHLNADCISPIRWTIPSASPRLPVSASASSWPHAGSKPTCRKFRRALPNTGLVQVSDYVSGDRATPNRAVPGDGMVPNAWLIGELLDAGYRGVFDLELVGPRIAAEGGFAATRRAAENLSEILVRLGA